MNRIHLLFLLLLINSSELYAECSGSIKEPILKVVVGDQVENSNDHYQVNIEAATKWHGNKIINIQFSSDGVIMDLVIDEQNESISKSSFMAASQWLQGNHCINSTYIETINGTLYTHEAKVPLKLNKVINYAPAAPDAATQRRL